MTRFVALIMALAGAAVAAPAVNAQNIGVVATVDPNLNGTPPGQSARRLTLGTDVVLNETIVSSRSGRGQLLFLDETTLSIAPSSRIVLDQFVYNPGNRDGAFGLRLTQGALRFIGGQTTKSREATIRTPSATIGIRGSSVLVRHVNGRTIAVFLMGDRMCMTAGGQRTCTSRQGSVIGENGFQGKITDASLRDLLENIDGAPPASLVRQASRGSGNGSSARNGANAGVTQAVNPRTRKVSTRGVRRQTGSLGLGNESRTGLGLFSDTITRGPLLTRDPVTVPGNGGRPDRGPDSDNDDDDDD